MSNPTWWIPDQKQYRPDTVRWWCQTCYRRTKLKRNPAWDGALKGDSPAPDRFVRCSVCETKHYQSNTGDCPNCGRPSDSPEGPDSPGTMISMTEPVSSRWAAMEFGGSPCDWTETHRCKTCKTVFTFTNGNY